jgi:hypothetical protein
MLASRGSIATSSPSSKCVRSEHKEHETGNESHSGEVTRRMKVLSLVLVVMDGFFCLFSGVGGHCVYQLEVALQVQIILAEGVTVG